MKYDVRHEAGFRYRTTATVIEQIAAETAPRVQAVTGLALPDRPRIRLVTPRGYRRASGDHFARVLQQDINDLNPWQRWIDAARQEQRDRDRHLRRSGWLLIGAETITDASGTPEVLFMPRAARHAGLLGPWLNVMVAHQLTTVAQVHTQPRLAVLAGTLMPEQRRDIDAQALMIVMVGQGLWAARTILAERGITATGGRTSRRYRRLTAAQPGPVPDGDTPTSQQPHEIGAAFVTHVEQVAPGAVNGVWNDLTRTPTTAELFDPPAWLVRTGITA
ncbi:hypothetical protein [Streptomyces sp. NBC_01803]|uniref:hypothetical protein n=1 Tax=Streptomyces sp. NBC_01803 TaxID=2975946 RepID=UPI002DDA5245|nr:hypothetical protein [Streptomyces sp. NBC_01803]WSA43701.1 hypothetical protein OIE51_05490 [Streptomyces sp. NBC_01803]